MPGGLTPGIRAVIKFHSIVPKHHVGSRETTPRSSDIVINRLPGANVDGYRQNFLRNLIVAVNDA
jgi:hypothetical protein